LARWGAIDPDDLDDALLNGAYGALARALDGPPTAVIESVKASGLQGRGGAFFPTALKWEACRTAAGEPRYVVLNGEEGEPGIFKDRHLMEGDPHQVLEGVLLAAYAAGATRAILYVHGEAELSAERLGRAVAQARAAGIVGDRMLGRDVACGVELRRGAGGFVLGEETALLESIEGRRAMPRTRPPFPVESGLWGKPTVINNVETLAAPVDAPREPRERVSPGTGGIVAVPAGASVLEIIKTLLAFNANESCGKCTPCREGTPRLLAMIDEFRASAEPSRVEERMRELATTIQLASLCGLGQAAPLALLRGLETFLDASSRGSGGSSTT